MIIGGAANSSTGGLATASNLTVELINRLIQVKLSELSEKKLRN